MEKSDAKLNVDEILERMFEVSGAKSITELAEMTGLSAQTISQSKYRQSIALPVLMRFVEKVKNSSIDYLIYGDCAYHVMKDNDDDIDYINLRSKGISNVKFHKNWLKELMIRHKIKDISVLKLYEVIDNIWIINTSDLVVTDGLWALGDPDMPIVRRCKRNLSGKIVVDGEEEQQSQEELRKIGVVGRIIWDGMSV